jgi:hypothetical protein
MMSEYSTNENYAKAIRHKITSTAKSMLEGELSFLSGARILASLRHEFPGGADDRDFLVFVAVDSETDQGLYIILCKRTIGRKLSPCPEPQ